ncbi:MAG TPA: EsaB/YukD family protein [Pyrinomonadaceae bacterium]|jgi:uncharacterized ubiquitin-like protein YukD
MNILKVEVWDVTGNKRVNVEVPDDVPVERVLIVLTEKLHLPKYNPDGRFMSYKLHHRRSGVQLFDEKNLGEQDVRDGDILRISPEMTAGCR